MGGAVERPAFAPALIDGLGDIAEHTVLALRGWSGNVLKRVVLADGWVLIAKRTCPAPTGSGARAPTRVERAC